MYRYDDFDQQLVDRRVDQFRDQVRRYLDGRIAEDDFKQLRLRNGLYMQRHAHMLRIAIPYGLLSARQLRMLAHVAETYDRGYGHFTTRQNIQLNWPELEDVPDILEHLASVQMHAIQTSGNLIRNITADPLGGVAGDEIADPRPYCELLRQWSTFHPEFSWLPRKFKIAVSGARVDRTALRFHDIGLEIVEDGERGRGFRVWVGGGMGRAPAIGKTIREFLPERDLLSYVEAILRIYNLAGRRDNIHRARIKVLVKSLGIDAFRDAVEEEWRTLRASALALDPAEIDRMAAHFTPPPYRAATGRNGLEAALADDPAFAVWCRQNTRDHRVPGYRVAFVSLKAPGVPPGDITAEQMRCVAALAERYSFSQIRATYDQNLVLADVAEGDLHALWQGLRAAALATANIGTLTDMICCPGLDFCSLANATSIPVAAEINDRFDELDHLYDLGEIELKMSGCMNACGHHHVGHIGILGVDKHGEEWYQLTLGGAPGNDAALGDRLGAAVPRAGVAETVARVLEVYVELREPEERFLDTYRRVGLEPFKERVYADDSQASDRRRRLAACA